MIKYINDKGTVMWAEDPHKITKDDTPKTFAQKKVLNAIHSLEVHESDSDIYLPNPEGTRRYIKLMEHMNVN